MKEDLDHILTHTRELWEQLRGQAIFITGGTGFFGRWLLESFAHANHSLSLGARAVVLTRNADAFRARAPHLHSAAGIDFVTSDVQRFTVDSLREQLGAALPQFRFVIHAATEASAKLNAENPLLMVDTIVEGTRRALDFAVAAGAQRFLLTSSGAVYGAQPPEVTHVREEFLGAPDCTATNSAYGEGKRLAELLCACFHQQHGIEPLIARCFAFVGPFLPLDTHFAVGNFIRDAMRGGPIQVRGDGTPHRSYLYAADLAIWLWTILLKGTPGRPYNVGSSHSMSIAEVAQAVAAAIDPQVRIEVAASAVPGQLPSRYVPSTGRAEQELGLASFIHFETAVKRTAAAATQA